MFFALDGTSAGSPTSGEPFISYRGGQWASDICAADAYQVNRWYRVSIERFDNRFTIGVAGDFAHGGGKGTVYYDDVRLVIWEGG